MNDEILPALAAAAVAVVVVLLLALLRLRAQTRRALDGARAEQDALRARLEELERRPLARDPERVEEFVITEVGDPSGGPAAEPVPTRIEGRLFADIVLRESVVKAASLAHGVRRALSPESRSRIRFEMRREVRRSSRQRRADVKEALRQYYARERGDVA